MRLALVLTLAASALASSDVQAFEAPRDDATLPDLAIAADEEIPIPELVAMWGRRFDALFVIDPRLNGSKLRFATPVTTLTWGTARAILEAHDLLVIESQPATDGPWVLRVHDRPLLGLGPHPLAAESSAAVRDELVTAVFSIAHGAGPSIFTTLSQNVSEGRPGCRLGALLYVPGPELIVVVDRPSTVSTLGALIETLDVDGPRPDLEPRRIVIESEVWEVETATDQLSIGVELAALRSTRPIGFAFPPPQVLREARLDPVVTRDAFDRIPLLLQMIASLAEARLVTKPFAVTNDHAPVTFSLWTPGCFHMPSADDPVHTLLVAPRIGARGDITLDVSLTLARGSDVRTSTASITVPNGRYVLLGLDHETERKVEDKVPLLGDLPLIGHAFRTWTRSISRSRVYIAVRPTVFAREGLAPCRGHKGERAAWLPRSVAELP